MLIGIGRLFVDGELAATRTDARYTPQTGGYPLRIGTGGNEISTGKYRFSGKLVVVIPSGRRGRVVLLRAAEVHVHERISVGRERRLNPGVKRP